MSFDFRRCRTTQPSVSGIKAPSSTALGLAAGASAKPSSADSATTALIALPGKDLAQLVGYGRIAIDDENGISIV